MALNNSPFSPENLRARFAELKVLEAAAHAELEPMETQRDALVASHQAQLDAMNLQIRETRELHSLFEVKQELATVVRALGGSEERAVRTAETEPQTIGAEDVGDLTETLED